VTFQPSISVIVPTHNRIDSLLPVLDAIFNQTYAPAEVIVADDGSSDGTADTLRAKSWPNLKVIELVHSGLPAVARNAAIKEAQGEWIAFCDSDDIWAPNKLERQVKSHNGHARAMCANAWASNQEGQKGIMFSQLPSSLTLNHILQVNKIINSTVVIERKLLDEVGGVAESSVLKGVEDYATWLRVASITPFQCLQEPLLTYDPPAANKLRTKTGSEGALTAPLAWLDFLAWMRQRGHPLTFSENFINVVLPRTIAANAKMQKNG